jgi:hypothetical protein
MPFTNNQLRDCASRELRMRWRVVHSVCCNATDKDGNVHYLHIVG